MFVPDNLAIQWRSYAPLYTFNLLAAQSLDLPESTTEFLFNLGLPVEHRRWFPVTRVYLDLPRLVDLMDHTDTTDSWGQLRVLTSYSVGNDVLRYDCVQEHSGRLFSAGYRGVGVKLELVFTNMDIICFAKFICTFANYARWLDQHLAEDPEPDYNLELTDMPDVMAVATATFDELRRCDPEACAEADEYLHRGEMLSADGWPILGWTTFLVRLAKDGRCD